MGEEVAVVVGSNMMKILNNFNRPNANNYISAIFKGFVELGGDRICGDDPAIVCGIAFLDDIPVTVIGQRRGITIDEQVKYNFSMTSPEGFRKALRIMKQAEKFHRPVICFVDTIGAYPGIEAEEHGQISAISHNIVEMMSLRVPIITVLIGYGVSGGALALCIADDIAILENSTLSVISPKACAEILWKDTKKDVEAIEFLKMTSRDLYEQGVVDVIITEPYGGAHLDFEKVADDIKRYLLNEVRMLSKLTIRKLVNRRQRRYRRVGQKFYKNSQ